MSAATRRSLPVAHAIRALGALLFLTLAAETHAGCDNDDRPPNPTETSFAIHENSVEFRWKIRPRDYIDLFLQETESGKILIDHPGFVRGSGEKIFPDMTLVKGRAYNIRMLARTEGGTQGCVSLETRISSYVYPLDPPAPAPAPPPGGDPVPDDWKDMLAAHNKRRQQHCAQPMQWSKKLADAAQVYVGQCKPDAHDPLNPALGYGENLAFYSTQVNGKPVLPAVSDRTAFENTWYCEHQWYDYDHPVLSPGFKQDCDPPVNGHFTQVVWKASRELGCARNTCTDASGNVGTMWSCKYSPAGNINTLQALLDNVSAPTCGAGGTRDLALDRFTLLARVGVDTSLPEAVVRGYLNNAYTAYPSIAQALLAMLNDKPLKQPVYLDVIVGNYEGHPGIKSPRQLSDVDSATLRSAIIAGYNERYGAEMKDFAAIVR